MPKDPPDQRTPLLERIFDSVLLQAILAFATVGGVVVPLMAAPGFRRWAHRQGPWIALSAAVLFLVLLGVIEVLARRSRVLRRDLADLRREMSLVQRTGTERDRRLAQELAADFSEARVLTLRNFFPKRFDRRELAWLAPFVNRWTQADREFNDEQLNEARRRLVSAVRDFEDGTLWHTFTVPGNYDVVEMSPKWSPEKRMEAANGMYAKRDALLEAYGLFIRTTRARGLLD